MTFEINGIPSEYLENAQWNKANLVESLDGRNVWGGFVPHTIDSTVMPMGEWETYKTMEGSQVIARTTNYFSRNEFRVYSGILKSITGTQRSLNMENVVISLLLFLGTSPSPAIQGIP